MKKVTMTSENFKTWLSIFTFQNDTTSICIEQKIQILFSIISESAEGNNQK